MKIKRWPLSIKLALREFFRAPDVIVNTNKYGQPLLSEWNDTDPYNSFVLNDTRVNSMLEEEKYKGALLFLEGRSRLEVVYLPDQKIVKLGPTCRNNIVINTSEKEGEQSAAASLSFDLFDKNSVSIKTSDNKSPFKVNGHEVTEAVVYDQDLITFCGSKFIFNQFEVQ